MFARLVSSPTLALVPALILLAGLGAGCAAASAAVTPSSSTPVPVGLFTDTRQKASIAVPTDATIVRSRLVDVNLPLLSGAGGPTSVKMVRLNLFPDVTFTAVLDRVDMNPNGFVWVGHVDGVPYSQVSLSVVDKVMMGSVAADKKVYTIRYLGNEVHAVYEINQAAFKPD